MTSCRSELLPSKTAPGNQLEITRLLLDHDAKVYASGWPLGNAWIARAARVSKQTSGPELSFG